MKFEHIVSPVDFSDTSFRALRFAADLARQFKSALHLVHVYERPYVGVTTGSGGSGDTSSGGVTVDRAEDHALREHIDERFHKLAESDFLTGLNVFKRLIPDIPAWRFYEELDLTKADVIVMGTSGTTGIIHGGLIGTNTERVIRLAPIPVISVPSSYEAKPIKKILYATNFSESSEQVFPQVVNAAASIGAEIVVGMVNTRENFQTTRFAIDEFNFLQHQYKHVHMSLVIHNYLTIEEGIWDMCQAYDIDLIAMHTHGRTGIAHLFRGSIAEDVSSNPNITIPLLTIKNKEEKASK
jgi:nucleotide-binding universal stress UspA family protein